jgi:hypothetical protein
MRRVRQRASRRCQAVAVAAGVVVDEARLAGEILAEEIHGVEPLAEEIHGVEPLGEEIHADEARVAGDILLNITSRRGWWFGQHVRHAT